MPEGPEVKRCSEVLSVIISEKILAEIKLVSGKLARIGIKNLDQLKLPSKVKSVKVKGKVIFIDLEDGYSIISTLGMSGWWYPPLSAITSELMSKAYYSKVIDTVSKAEKHTRLSLVMDDGSIANYVDPRNFGNIYVVDEKEREGWERKIGFDLLSDKVHHSAQCIFHEETQRKKYANKAIGQVLLDQSLASGLGNIYRSEALYLSGISPKRITGTLSIDETSKIVTAAKMVLEVAYYGRGSMFYPINEVKHFLHHDNLIQRLKSIMPPDTMAVNGHLVYGRNFDIMNHEVRQEDVGGRTAWWVPEVQS